MKTYLIYIAVYLALAFIASFFSTSPYIYVAVAIIASVLWHYGRSLYLKSDRAVYSQHEVERLTAIGDKYYDEAIEGAKKNIESSEKLAQDKTNTVMFNWTAKQREKYVMEAYSNLERLKELKNKFVRLVEKYKHVTIKEKFFIYQDWADLGWYLHSIGSNNRRIDVADNIEPILDDTKDNQLKIEEIDKRFNLRLAN